VQRISDRTTPWMRGPHPTTKLVFLPSYDRLSNGAPPRPDAKEPSMVPTSSPSTPRPHPAWIRMIARESGRPSRPPPPPPPPRSPAPIPPALGPGGGRRHRPVNFNLMFPKAAGEATAGPNWRPSYPRAMLQRPIGVPDQDRWSRVPPTFYGIGVFLNSAVAAAPGACSISSRKFPRFSGITCAGVARANGAEFRSSPGCRSART